MFPLFRVCRHIIVLQLPAMILVILVVVLAWPAVSEAQHFDTTGYFPAYVSDANYKLERGPAVFEQVYEAESPFIGNVTRGNGFYAGKVMVIVGASLYPLVKDSLIRLYASDLQTEGYSVKIVTVSGGVGDDIRALLKTNQTDLKGALMVGDVPIPFWKFRTHEGAGAMDLGYMDLDGEWIDTTGEGYWDVVSAGSGDLGAEIWTGWVYPVHMGSLSTQAALVNDYFSRNHWYRTGALSRQLRAKMFLDGEWAIDSRPSIAAIDTALRSLYPAVSQFKDSTVTGRRTYSDSLQANNEFWFVTTHSGFSAHTFNPPTGREFVRWADIDSISTQPLFYYVYACGAGAYYLDSCIANYYVLGSASGLTLTASTVIGGMSLENISILIQRYSEGMTFGEALVNYLNPTTVANPEIWDDFNEIMMSIMGDPTLRPARQVFHVTPDGTGSAATIQAAIDSAHNGAIILLAPGTYRGVGNRDIDFRGKHVTVAPESVSTQVIIDCEHMARGFRFHLEEDYLSCLAGVTIINGMASDSGGAILVEGSSSPQIIDCLMRDNTCLGNGGALAIYGDAAPLVKNCTMVRNSGVEGGGAYLASGSGRIADCLIAFNQQGGITYSGSDLEAVSCCDVFGNLGGDWRGTTDMSMLNGNVVADPKFCDTTLRLFTLDNTSPCSPAHSPCGSLIGSEPVECFALCGDADASGAVDISDAVFLISFIFTGGSAPEPLRSGDASCDQTVDISDVVYLISFIFTGGPAPCALCK